MKVSSDSPKKRQIPQIEQSHTIGKPGPAYSE